MDMKLGGYRSEESLRIVEGGETWSKYVVWKRLREKQILLLRQGKMDSAQNSIFENNNNKRTDTNTAKIIS